MWGVCVSVETGRGESGSNRSLTGLHQRGNPVTHLVWPHHFIVWVYTEHLRPELPSSRLDLQNRVEEFGPFLVWTKRSSKKY